MCIQEGGRERREIRAHRQADKLTYRHSEEMRERERRERDRERDRERERKRDRDRDRKREREGERERETERDREREADRLLSRQCTKYGGGWMRERERERERDERVEKRNGEVKRWAARVMYATGRQCH